MKSKRSIATILTALLLLLLLAGCSSQKAGEIKTEEKETSTEAAKTEAPKAEETKAGNAETAAAESVTDGEPFKFIAAVDSGTFAYPFWVAENKGIFDKYNIEPEIQTYAYGIDTINAVTLDQADLGEAMDFAAISRLGGDSQLQFISFIAGNKMEGSHLYVLGDDIKEPKDLEGKSVVVQKGTVNEYVLGTALCSVWY
ncbi:ABC transporter substrate-binding protein [Lachnospiraceae bacterium 54-53]